MNIVRISDGLGNQMFQYAFARKVSILTGKKVYLDIRYINNEDMYRMGKRVHYKGKLKHRKYGLQYFRTSLPVADDKILLRWRYLQQSGYVQRMIYSLSVMNKWIWAYRNEELNFKGNLTKIKCMIPTYYQGYFFNLIYFDDIKGTLQQEFSLKQKIKLPRKLGEIIKYRNTVSIHIRRGDFLRLNRDISDSEYYNKAIELVEERIDSPIYLLFTDDIEWVKQNINIHYENILVSDMGFKDYEEFTIMKHCRNNIIANSTFSYWAAYLNSNFNKLVICPKNWRSATIPNEWVRI